MSAPIGLVTGAVRGWVALYTLGLPSALRASRRSEIDCDLWEQRRAASLSGERAGSTTIELFVRLLLGIPADLAWRIEARAAAAPKRRLSVNRSAIVRALGVACLLTLVLVPVAALSIVIKNGWDGVLWALFPLLGSIAIVTGLLTVANRPGRAMALVVTGCLAVALTWFWLFMITVPIGIGIIAIAYSRARQAGWSWPRGARAA